MRSNANGTRLKEIICREHGGSFSIPVGRGRPPVKCGGKYAECGGRSTPRKAVAAKTPAKAAETVAERPKRTARGADTRPGKRERVSALKSTGRVSTRVVVGEDDMRPIDKRVSRSEKSGWCRCPEMNKEPHERGSEGCKYNQPDPTRSEKELPEFFAYFPARMKGDQWVILHAAGCDHLNERQLKRTDTVTLNLFADDMANNLSKLDVDGLGYDWNNVGVTNCALNLAKRHRTATQRAAEKAAPLAKTVNPCIPLAHKAKTDLEPLGWAVKGRQWAEGDVFHAQVTATRGTETLLITWTADKEGKITSDQQYSLWDSEKPSENRKPKAKSKLPFNPALVSDKELIQAIAGQRVTWQNRLRSAPEEYTVSPERIQIDHTYNGNGDSVPSERIVKFTDFGGGGFRAFKLSQLLTIG